MVLLDNLFAALASLDPTTLLNTAVIFTDIPSKIPKRFSVGFRCIKDIGSSIFSISIRMNNSNHIVAGEQLLLEV
jgi:hypothetical protein